jgi:hypothetical protein
MSKHNHHNESSMLCKFVRRGIPVSNSFESRPSTIGRFSKKEAVAICMESPLYFELSVRDRKSAVERLSY